MTRELETRSASRRHPCVSRLAIPLVLAIAGTSCGRSAQELPAAAPDARRVTVIDLVETPGSEESRRGVMSGLADAGLVEGRDIVVTHRSAQGDMTLLPTIVDAARTQGVDLFVTISTPTLQAVLQRGGQTPTVFTYCANPMLAGAGASEQEHLSWVTGIYTLNDFPGMLEIVAQCLPRARRLGTLYCPSEDNSVFYRDELARQAKVQGIEVVSVPINTPTDVADAATALCGQSIDAVCQIHDNLTAAAFPAISVAASRAGVPLLGFSSSQAAEGAVLVVARDYEDAGHATGLVAARVLRGESPAAIPFRLADTSRLIVNLRAARQLGIGVPESVVTRAWRVIAE